MNILVTNFNTIVNNIINLIQINEQLNKILFKCSYRIFDNKSKVFIQEEKYILCFCLGGMAYQYYNNILSKYFNEKITLNTMDYDISFSLPVKTSENIKIITEQITDIYTRSIQNYIFEFEYNYKKYKITKNNFEIKFVNKFDRLQMIINCKIGNYQFHILELCFWYNGKISDNYTINDFEQDKLFIYICNNGLKNYLLPLDKLIKTTFYALQDNYEKENFSKCNKYLDRVRYIKLVHDEYYSSSKNNILLNYIFRNYMRVIYKKYKMMFDYPFISSKLLVDIYNKELVKCIYRELRTNSHKIFIENINKFKKICEQKENKLNHGELTEEDIEKQLE